MILNPSNSSKILKYLDNQVYEDQQDSLRLIEKMDSVRNGSLSEEELGEWLNQECATWREEDVPGFLDLVKDRLPQSVLRVLKYDTHNTSLVKTLFATLILLCSGADARQVTRNVRDDSTQIKGNSVGVMTFDFSPLSN